MQKKQHGTVSIEFAMSAFVLFMMIFAVFELSRFIYINNLVDIAITESSRQSRIHDNMTSERYYDNTLANLSKGTLWHSIAINKKDFTLKQVCFHSPAGVVNGQNTTDCEHAKLAIYTLTYHYRPVLVISGMLEMDITRSVLIQNEYQGW